MADMQIKEPKPTDRVQVLDNPAAPPGKCAVCGNGADKERQWIDFGVTIDFVGALYICSICITEVANALNFSTPSQTSQMLIKIDDLTTALRRVDRERESLHSAIVNLNAGGIRVDNPTEPAAERQDPLPIVFDAPREPESELDLD
jgi:hypothetical protein